MGIAWRLMALAVALATAGAAAAGTIQPRLASLGATAPGGGDVYVAAASLCAGVIDEVNARDRFGNNTIRELNRPDWHADEQAVEGCRSAADHGNAAARYVLGFMYREGLGVPQNLAEAAKWFRKSADLGLALAQTNVGFMYAKGEGVPQSRAEAMKWTRLAAEQGDAVAQYNLGLMYSDGRGDPQDLVQAYMWLNLATAQGYRQAETARDQVAAWIGSSAEIAKAQRMAVERSAAGARLAEDDQPRR